MNIIIASLIAIIIILLLIIYATWFDKIGRMRKEDFFEKAIDKFSSIIDSKIELATDLHKAGPWYLLVYTKDSGYPICISHNNIRSVHPDQNNHRIIIKTFDREDMVIDNVSSYDMFAANDIIGCGM